MSGFSSNITSFGQSWTQETKEVSLQSILEKLRVDCPYFPLYLRRFNSPYFIYSNDVEYQGQTYCVYARRNQESVSLEFFESQTHMIEIRSIRQSSDITITKQVPVFNF